MIELQRAPEKPKFSEPCNGCGYCCAAELCKVGKHLHGENHPAPCPSMVFSVDRFLCGAVLAMDKTDVGPVFRMLMGIGIGCDSD